MELRARVEAFQGQSQYCVALSPLDWKNYQFDYDYSASFLMLHLIYGLSLRHPTSHSNDNLTINCRETKIGKRIARNGPRIFHSRKVAKQLTRQLS